MIKLICLIIMAICSIFLAVSSITMYITNKNEREIRRLRREVFSPHNPKDTEEGKRTCENCKYQHKSEHDYPCSNCKHNHPNLFEWTKEGEDNK